MCVRCVSAAYPAVPVYKGPRSIELTFKILNLQITFRHMRLLHTLVLVFLLLGAAPFTLASFSVIAFAIVSATGTSTAIRPVTFMEN